MKVDVAVVGAGVAGLAIAQVLASRGMSVAVTKERDAAASRLPSAIVHAFAGRSAARPLALEAFEYASRWYGKEGQGPHVHVTTMVRPVQGADSRLWRSAKRVEAEARKAGLTVEFHDRAAAADRYPLLTSPSSVVAYAPAFVIDGGGLLDKWRQELNDAGVTELDLVTGLDRISDGWHVATGGGGIEVDRVVLCPGSGAMDWFPRLGLEAMAGAALCATADRELEYAVSAGGRHWAPMGGTRVCVGATRHAPDERVADARVLSGLTASPLVGLELSRPKIWRGVRCVNPSDRRPLAGPVPGQDGVFAVLAMGSTGYFWAPYVAERMADLIAGGAAVPAALSVERARGSYESPRIR